MLELLRAEVCTACKMLPEHGLVILTWGNVSAIDREKGLVVIKPSGVPYEDLTAEQMVVVDLEGNRLEGTLRPSSDLPTHLELYRAFPQVGAVIHTHSQWATIWAQVGRGIQPYGTTHADYFYGQIPCTRPLRADEVAGDYERNTGKVIVETFQTIDYEQMPAVLVHRHGPFCWGTNVKEALENAVTLEQVACMAWHTESLLQCRTSPLDQSLLDRHFFRKHGASAYYGQ
ncbi:MAG TPA: L-ribulose-5-phosphate 4-epimerase [Firmicutes bacterium]|nr:L-ribulose-5-phosphate 4-epimerase [Bacillota bacterium]